jgi:hypothetical protein
MRDGRGAKGRQTRPHRRTMVLVEIGVKSFWQLLLWNAGVVFERQSTAAYCHPIGTFLAVRLRNEPTWSVRGDSGMEEEETEPAEWTRR